MSQWWNDEKAFNKNNSIVIGMLCSCRLMTSQCQSRQLMHCDTLRQDNDSTVRGDGGSRVGEVRAGTTSPMPEHKGFML